MAKEKIEAYLRENDVPYEVRHHPVAYTSQRVAQSEHIPGKFVAKVVVVFADDKMTLLALPAPLHVDLKKAAAVLGAKEVRLATEDEFAGHFPDCEVGAVPPIGSLYGLPLYVDTALAEDEKIVFDAGTHTDTITVTYEDFARVAEPEVADFAVRS
jgi:Ala-tRNA(Pro) deacylase